MYWKSLYLFLLLKDERRYFLFRIPGVNFETLLQAIKEGSEELLKEMTDVIAAEIIRTECCKSEVSMFENYLELDFTLLQAMKAQRRRGIALLLNLGDKWRWLVSATS